MPTSEKNLKFDHFKASAILASLFLLGKWRNGPFPSWLRPSYSNFKCKKIDNKFQTSRSGIIPFSTKYLDMNLYMEPIHGTYTLHNPMPIVFEHLFCYSHCHMLLNKDSEIIYRILKQLDTKRASRNTENTFKCSIRWRSYKKS